MDFNDKFKNAVRDNFNRSTKDYETLEGEYVFFHALTRSLVRAIGLTHQEKESISAILDIGSGTGSSTACLKEIFPHANVVGVDLSEKMVELAQKNYPELDFICGDGESIDSYFSPESFDFIIYPASLFLIPNQEKALIAADRLLKKGGFVAASILIGLREEEGRSMKSLPEFRGILKSESTVALFTSAFNEVRVDALTIPLDIDLLSAIYRIEALSAGAFRGKNQEERNQELQKLIGEALNESHKLGQDWILLTGHKLDGRNP